MPRLLQDLALAAAFLTRLSVPARWQSGGDGALARAMGWFPLIGFSVGVAAGGLAALARLAGLPPLPAAVVAVASAELIAGGLHSDGLCDFADGLAAGGDVERRLAVMRESATGAHGLLALLLVVLAQVAALASLAAPWLLVAAMAAAAALGRAGLVAVAATLPAASEQGLAAQAGRPGRGGVLAALASAGLVSYIVLPGWLAPTAGLVAAAAGSGLVAGLARAMLGGISGDGLGATAQMAATFALLALAGSL